MTAYCARCGDHFEAKGEWQRLCWDCWRADKDSKDRAIWDRGYRAGQQDAQRRPTWTARAPTLDPQTIRDLIQLCHPDRHPPERGELANRATARLLDLLTNTRKAA